MCQYCIVLWLLALQAGTPASNRSTGSRRRWHCCATGVPWCAACCQTACFVIEKACLACLARCKPHHSVPYSQPPIRIGSASLTDLLVICIRATVMHLHHQASPTASKDWLQSFVALPDLNCVTAHGTAPLMCCTSMSRVTFCLITHLIYTKGDAKQTTARCNSCACVAFNTLP